MAEFPVTSEREERLDKFIRREYLYLSQGIIEKYLRTGQIQVNNKKVKSSTRLTKGDKVTINDNIYSSIKPKNELSRKLPFSPAIITLAKKILNEYLLFSSDQFIAINKPYALATQGGSKINISIDHALTYLNETTNSTYKLVHRLDKDTSGVLIIAKNLDSCISLNEAFQAKEIKKNYLAIVLGTVNPNLKKGIIEGYIAKEKSGTYEVIRETQIGKLAQTEYEILANNGHFSAIKYIPLTGRMHQLRFHSKQLGCPILGDVKYGGEPFSRMMLHAREIVIPAKIFGKEFIINAPIDIYFESYLFQLGYSLEK